MPCLHKFHEDLNLDGIDFVPTTLIVGTFNPIWPAGNPAQWFYGRVARNYFWDVLPRLFHPDLNLRPGNPDLWKQFCSENCIALTDMITSIDDAFEDNVEHQAILRNYQDAAIANNFNQFTFTDIIGILTQYPNIRNVYFTRQPGIELCDDRWALVEAFSNNNRERHLHIRNLLTPSGFAMYQIGPYRAANPNDPTPLRNFIFQSWMLQWHQIGIDE